MSANDTTAQNRRMTRGNGRSNMTASPAPPQYSYIVTLPAKTSTANESSTPDPNRSYSIVLSEIITTLDPATHTKILQQTTLSIEELIKPKGKFRNGVPPRPQNPWVIYRKDLQAKLVQEQGAEIEFGARVGSISRMASEKWNNEPQEVKQVYEIIAEVAKRVHEQMFPNYKYKPRRKGNNSSFSRRSSSASDISMETFKRNVGDFKSNTSSFQIERLERRKSSESETMEDIKNINNIHNHNTNPQSLPGSSKKPYPSPPLTSGAASSSSHPYLHPLPPGHASTSPHMYPRGTNQLPWAASSIPSSHHHDGHPQQNIIPSWTLYDTSRISPANIFTDGSTQPHPNINKSGGNESLMQNYHWQQISSQLLEMSPSMSCMVTYDRNLTRLFGAP